MNSDSPQPGGRVPGLSVVLPAYNEEANVGPMIEAALEVLPSLASDYEVIVDDGSPRRDLGGRGGLGGAALPRRVRLLVHDTNRGYGAAIRTGLQHAGPRVAGETTVDPATCGGR